MTTAHDLDLAATRERATLATQGRDDRPLIRFATLTASSHNTRPWRFRMAPDVITIIPDLSRRCPVVDPDDAHLYRSLGLRYGEPRPGRRRKGLQRTSDSIRHRTASSSTSHLPPQRRPASCSRRSAPAKARDSPSTAHLLPAGTACAMIVAIRRRTPSSAACECSSLMLLKWTTSLMVCTPTSFTGCPARTIRCSSG